MEFKQQLKQFFKKNDGTYYIITDRQEYTTVLRVDDNGFEALNTEKFVLKNIGTVEQNHYLKGSDRLDFVVRGRQYFLFNYDAGVVSI